MRLVKTVLVIHRPVIVQRYFPGSRYLPYILQIPFGISRPVLNSTLHNYRFLRPVILL
jgi:hypothetical protein